MPAHFRPALAGVGLVALMTTAIVNGQPPRPDKPDAPPIPRIGRAGETTLFMMVRTGPHLTPDNLKSTLQEGLTAAKCGIAGEPLIRPVSPAVFEEIENLTNDTAAAVGSANPAAVKPASGLRRSASRDLLWEFRLNSPSQILKKLKVKYKKTDGSEYDKEYTATGPADDGPLNLVAPGTYSFKPEATDTPTGYEAEVVSLGQQPEKMEGKWPSSDRYYIITMRNFRGDKDWLFHVLQDGTRVANPLDSIRLGSDLVFVFANLDALGADEDDDVIAGNNLILGSPPPRDRTPARGWFLFPLSDAGMKEQMAAFRKITSPQELIAKIRENAIHASQPTEVTPDMTPKWLELPSTGDVRSHRYRRELPMKDFKGLLDKYPSAYGLIVWEFENAEGMRSAIQMKLPGGGLSMVREKELRNWSNSLKEKVNAPAK